MRIHILNESKQSLGGGWSFIRNFQKGVKQGNYAQLVDDWRTADIVFIPASSMVQRDTVSIIKGAGKKIILRLDNIPRNSRNRGAGTTRLYDISQMADSVIYQSKWAKDYLTPFLNRDEGNIIIYNGVDTEVFKKEGTKLHFPYDLVVLYSRYSRDETKGWERAWYEYQMIHRQAKAEGKRAMLLLCGRFSDELRNYNFDFYNNEEFDYLGVIEDPQYMARVMRSSHILLAPYFNDCYSNTIQEAISCGLEVRADLSGGTPELLYNGVITLDTMVTNYMRYFNELLQTTT